MREVLFLMLGGIVGVLVAAVGLIMAAAGLCVISKRIERKL